jgi:hypothetical protein
MSMSCRARTPPSTEGEVGCKTEEEGRKSIMERLCKPFEQ